MIKETVSKLLEAVQSRQRSWSGYLGKRFNALSTAGKKRALLVFCLAASALCARVLVQAFGERKPASAAVQPICPPAALEKTGEPPEKDGFRLSESLRRKIAGFRHYLDSLQNDENGKRVYDSLKRSRPGLIDSLEMTEDLFHLR